MYVFSQPQRLICQISSFSPCLLLISMCRKTFSLFFKAELLHWKHLPCELPPTQVNGKNTNTVLVMSTGCKKKARHCGYKKNSLHWCRHGGCWGSAVPTAVELQLAEINVAAWETIKSPTLLPVQQSTPPAVWELLLARVTAVIKWAGKRLLLIGKKWDFWSFWKGIMWRTWKSDTETLLA